MVEVEGGEGREGGESLCFERDPRGRAAARKCRWRRVVREVHPPPPAVRGIGNPHGDRDNARQLREAPGVPRAQRNSVSHRSFIHPFAHPDGDSALLCTADLPSP